jgi:hypothetical protein
MRGITVVADNNNTAPMAKYFIVCLTPFVMPMMQYKKNDGFCKIILKPRLFQNFSSEEADFACPATYKNRRFAVRTRRAKNCKSRLQNNRFCNRLNLQK